MVIALIILFVLQRGYDLDHELTYEPHHDLPMKMIYVRIILRSDSHSSGLGTLRITK